MTTMKEDFISYKTLKLAKEKGIDFWKEQFTPMKNMTMSVHKNTYHLYVTQALFQRLLRERYCFDIMVAPHLSKTSYGIEVFHNRDYTNIGADTSFDTYEKALEAGIQGALNRLKTI